MVKVKGALQMKKGENIYKRKDGRWEGRYKDGYKANSEIKYRSVYGKSYSEVKLKLSQEKLQARKFQKQQKLKMNEVYKLYIENIQFNVKISTISNYRNLYDNHINPHFGGCRIDKISNEMINKFISDKLSSNLSTKFVSDVVCLLKSILKFAIKRNWIQQQDYDIIKFKVSTKPIEVFTDNEVSIIIKNIIDRPTLPNISILFALCMGLRIGEICALKVNDIDFNNEIIHVNKTLQRITNPIPDAQAHKTIVITDKAKTIASIRNVPIPNFIIQILKESLYGSNNSAYFLTRKLDRFIEPRMLEKYFKQFLKSAGIIYKNFHTLRHTFATYSIRNNLFDLKTLSQILGHSNIKTTYSYYLHTDIATQKRQMQRLNDEFISRQDSCHATTNKRDLGTSSAF